MTTRDNIIYYTTTAVVFIGIVVCSVWSQPNTTNTEMNEEKQRLVKVIAPYAPIINALAVLTSTFFIIWTTCFRKTRRDRIDELKVEMQVLFSQITQGRNLRVDYDKGPDEYFQQLNAKFQKEIYKVLYRPAYDELVSEGKVKVEYYSS